MSEDETIKEVLQSISQALWDINNNCERLADSLEKIVTTTTYVVRSETEYLDEARAWRTNVD